METGQRIYSKCKLRQRDIIYSSAEQTKLIEMGILFKPRSFHLLSDIPINY